MTRRDYVLVAEVCKRHKLPETFLIDLAETMHEQNVRFNRKLFLEEATYVE